MLNARAPGRAPPRTGFGETPRAMVRRVQTSSDTKGTKMTDPHASGYGKLTEEGLARARRRIGVFQPLPNPPHNYEVTWDGVRHFAFGYGDDNPLFCDPE